MLWSSSPTTNGATPPELDPARPYWGPPVATRGGGPRGHQQLAREGPALRPGDDSEARGHAERAPIRSQPRQRDRVKRAHCRRRRTDEVLDAIAHLRGRAVGERHHQDRAW